MSYALTHFEVKLRNEGTTLLRTTDENTALRFAGWGFPVAGMLDDEVLGFIDLAAIPSWRLQAALLPLL